MIKTGWKAEGLAAVTPQEGKKVMKENLSEMADTWHAVYLPRHFNGGAENIYKLQYRTPKYVKAARKYFPNWRPLVASGSMKNACTTNFKKTPDIKEGKMQIKIAMRRGHATQPYVGAEVTSINGKEVKELMHDFKEGFIADIAATPSKSEGV